MFLSAQQIPANTQKAKSIAAVFETERTPVRDGERCKKDRTDDCTDQCKQTEVLTLCY